MQTTAVPASSLARCVGDPTAFAAQVWQRRPLLLSAVDNPWVPGADVLSPDDIDALLAGRALRAPFVRLVRDGATVPERQWTRTVRAGDRTLSDLPDSARVAALFAGGATIVLQALHRVHPALGDFCRGLAGELGHQTQTNVYITPPGAQGFRAHHDTHDVLVVQVDGSKHWTVRQPLVDLPLPAQPSSGLDAAAAAASPVALDVVLRPGDVLYLPRGWLHEAATGADRSIHLTIGLLQATWWDVLGDAVALAVDVPALRGALPLVLDGEDPDVEGFRSAALDWLRELPAERLAGLVAQRRARAAPPEPVPPLAQEEAMRALTLRSPLRPRAGLAWRILEEGERTVVHVGRGSVSVPAWVGPALRQALAGPSTPGGLGLQDRDDGIVLARRLLREGLLLPA